MRNKIVIVILSALIALAMIPPLSAYAESISEDMIRWGSTVLQFTGDPQSPQFEITDLQEGVDYHVEYYVQTQDGLIAIEGPPSEEGSYTISIVGIEQYVGSEVSKSFTIVNWGAKVTNSGIVNYIDADGKTSAEVTGNQVIWLKEDSEGSSVWYGVDNSNGVFEKGSRFWAKWLDKDQDKDLFEEYYNKLDEKHKKAVSENKLWIFQTGVTGPDGREYVGLASEADLYIQLGDDWNPEDVRAVFISGMEDEEVECSSVNPANYSQYFFPGSGEPYEKIRLKHFSPYAVFEKGSSDLGQNVPVPDLGTGGTPTGTGKNVQDNTESAATGTAAPAKSGNVTADKPGKSTASVKPAKVRTAPGTRLIAGKGSLTVEWKKVKRAAGYDIFLARCNHDKQVIPCRKVKTVKGNKILKWTRNGLKNHTAYKACVKAYTLKNGRKTYIAASPLMHAYTGDRSGGFTNAGAIRLNKTKVSLKRGKSFVLKAKVNVLKKQHRLMPKTHAPRVRYLSTDTGIATVSGSGRIKAVGKGTCRIYAYAHNGVYKSVKVTVK